MCRPLLWRVLPRNNGSHTCPPCVMLLETNSRTVILYARVRSLMSLRTLMCCYVRCVYGLIVRVRVHCRYISGYVILCKSRVFFPPNLFFVETIVIGLRDGVQCSTCIPIPKKILFHVCGLHSQWSESDGDQCRAIRTMAVGETTELILQNMQVLM